MEDSGGIKAVRHLQSKRSVSMHLAESISPLVGKIYPITHNFSQSIVSIVKNNIEATVKPIEATIKSREATDLCESNQADILANKGAGIQPIYVCMTLSSFYQSKHPGSCHSSVSLHKHKNAPSVSSADPQILKISSSFIL